MSMMILHDDVEETELVLMMILHDDVEKTRILCIETELLLVDFN